VAPSGASQPARIALADVSDPEQAVAVSPAVGMFKAGVAVGTRVRAGDRIATVDLLGIALDVVAPIDGTVAEVYPQSGDGVEYGEEIALVEADAPEPKTAVDGPGEG
jgi:biotin carboxyl carrier protein